MDELIQDLIDAQLATRTGRALWLLACLIIPAVCCWQIATLIIQELS